jgi:signal peptidase I
LKDHEGEPNIIKRVIGKPGDQIEIREDGVYRNDVRLDEPYLTEGTPTVIRNLAFAKVKLGEDEYYVMGDNRGVSLDSRSFGPVPKDAIIGEVLIRFYPFSALGIP